MGIRGYLSLILLGALTLSGGFLIVLTMLVKEELLALFPPELYTQAYDALQVLVLEQAIVLILFSAGTLVVLLWILSALIVRPLKAIVECMEEYSRTGEQKPLPKLTGAPSEIQTLGTVFADFTTKVSTAHERDAEISRVKSDFISTAAHQFRTPLTGIRWALEALEKEPLTPEQLAIVKNAKDKSHDLVEIMKTLLDISSIESGKYKYQFAPVDMGELVEEVARDFGELAKAGQVSLFYAKNDEARHRARADKERIKWVLNNLVDNAIRYTPPGGTVRIATEPGPGRVYVKVSDSGIGILPQDRANIFERFYRAGNAIAKQNQGNGLGLYIARTIAKDHGGDLNFESNTTGPGTTFVLALPMVS